MIINDILDGVAARNISCPGGMYPKSDMILLRRFLREAVVFKVEFGHPLRGTEESWGSDAKTVRDMPLDYVRSPFAVVFLECDDGGMLIRQQEEGGARYLLVTMIYRLEKKVVYVENDVAIIIRGPLSSHQIEFQVNGKKGPVADSLAAMVFWFIGRFFLVLHCVNVKRVLIPSNPKMRKKRQKKGRSPLVSFYTLELEPTSKKERQKQTEGLWRSRVHLCRGHFKRYTAERPLFGKYEGLYWWNPQARGKGRGYVVKDYRLKGTA